MAALRFAFQAAALATLWGVLAVGFLVVGA